MFNPTIYLIFSYLIGSIPFSYLVPFWFAKRNIPAWLANNAWPIKFLGDAGKIQNILVMILDFVKGFFVVYLAFLMGGESNIQLWAGFFCVLGNNWSVFLHFGGGRGFSVFAGALLFFSPKIFLIFLGIVLLGDFLWHLSIGKLAGIIFVVYGSAHLEFSELPAFLGNYCVLLLLLKRLSPMAAFFHAANLKKLFLSRLLFDSDEFPGQKPGGFFRKLTNKENLLK